MHIPLEYLLAGSNTMRESFELSRLDHAARMRKQIMAELEQWIEDRVGAEIARLLRMAQLGSIGFDPRQEQFDFPQSEGASSPTSAGHQKGVRQDRASD